MESLNKIVVERQCIKCELNKCIDKFRQYTDISYSNTCKKCVNEMDKLRKINLRKKKSRKLFGKM